MSHMYTSELSAASLPSCAAAQLPHHILTSRPHCTPKPITQSTCTASPPPKSPSTIPAHPLQPPPPPPPPPTNLPLISHCTTTRVPQPPLPAGPPAPSASSSSSYSYSFPSSGCASISRGCGIPTSQTSCKVTDRRIRGRMLYVRLQRRELHQGQIGVGRLGRGRRMGVRGRWGVSRG